MDPRVAEHEFIARALVEGQCEVDEDAAVPGDERPGLGSHGRLIG